MPRSRRRASGTRRCACATSSSSSSSSPRRTPSARSCAPRSRSTIPSGSAPCRRGADGDPGARPALQAVQRAPRAAAVPRGLPRRGRRARARGRERRLRRDRVPRALPRARPPVPAPAPHPEPGVGLARALRRPRSASRRIAASSSRGRRTFRHSSAGLGRGAPARSSAAPTRSTCWPRAAARGSSTDGRAPALALLARPRRDPGRGERRVPLLRGASAAGNDPFTGVADVELVDRFEDALANVRRARNLCVPADTATARRIRRPSRALRDRARHRRPAPHAGVSASASGARSAALRRYASRDGAAGADGGRLVDTAGAARSGRARRRPLQVLRRAAHLGHAGAPAGRRPDGRRGPRRAPRAPRRPPADALRARRRRRRGMKQPTPALACLGVTRGPGAPRYAARRGCASQTTSSRPPSTRCARRRSVCRRSPTTGAATVPRRSARGPTTRSPTPRRTTRCRTQDEGWVGPNQHHGITQQLADGVRGLMLDTHYFAGVPTLCHALCQLGNEPLVSGLGKIRTFLERHPTEVVSIIFESYVSAADTTAAFTGERPRRLPPRAAVGGPGRRSATSSTAAGGSSSSPTTARRDAHPGTTTSGTSPGRRTTASRSRRT